MHLDCYFSPTGINNELVIYKFVDLTAVNKCFMWMNWIVLQMMLKYVSGFGRGFVSNELKNMGLHIPACWVYFSLCNSLVNKLNSLERHVPYKQGKHHSGFRTVLHILDHSYF